MTDVSEAMPVFISGFNELEQQLISKLYEAKNSDPPVKLYHYTKLLGLKGMISSNCLWATRFDALNDSKEISYGFDVLEKVLNQHADNSTSDVSTFLSRISSSLSHNKSNYMELFETYVISFTEEPDMLSQWRAYADGGQGTSIEFDFNDSRILTLTDNEVPFYFSQLPVIYDEDLQCNLITESIDVLVDYINNSSLTINQIVNSDISIQGIVTGLVFHFFTPFINSFKHRAFHEEKEWRAIAACPTYSIQGTRKSRSLNAFKTYYIEAYFATDDTNWITQKETLPITKITKGPLVTEKVTAEIVELVLENDYHKQLTIENSTIPLR